MDYDLATFRSDLALLQLKDGTPPTPRLLALKRNRMAKEPGHDQAALSAAHDRLASWAMRFAEMQLSVAPEGVTAETANRAADPPSSGEVKDTAPASAKAEEKARAQRQIAAAKTAWQAAVTGQEDRHRRRRSAYPDVKPDAAGPR